MKITRKGGEGLKEWVGEGGGGEKGGVRGDGKDMEEGSFMGKGGSGGTIGCREDWYCE